MTWPMTPLADILIPSNDRIALLPDVTYSQVTARLWGKGLTLRGRVTGAEIAATQQNRVRAGQFVISKIDARHGAFGIVPAELDGAVVSNDFPVFDVDASVALSKYVAWAGRTDWFVSLCRKASEGSTNRVRLKATRFLSQFIPLPPLDEQREIVARLDAAASAIEARTRATGSVDAEVAATLAAAFTRIVADAPRIAMADVAPLVRRPLSIDPYANYPELGVRSFGKGTFHKPALAGIDVGSKKLFEIASDDLLFNIVFAWEGAVAVARPEDDRRVGSHRFLSCVPLADQATPTFLRYWFLSDEGMSALGRASPGGAGRNRTLGIKALQDIRVPVPPLGAQRWFDRLQAKVQEARDAQVDAAKELAKLLPAMLSEAFGNGQ